MSSQGKSRLDKLLLLLQNGSSLGTRQEAGRQIAEIAKASPAQLPTLQRKLSEYLASNVWETRVAAGDTLGRMAEHFQQPSVSDLQKAVLGTEMKQDPYAESEAGAEDAPASAVAPAASSMKGSESAHDLDTAAFAFETFDMKRVLEKGTPLLGSGGQEYDQWQAELSTATAEERLDKERKNLKNRLGLGDGMTSFMDTNDLIDDEDLMTSSSAPAPEKSNLQEASQLVDEMAGGLSARERNRLKRKARKDGPTKKAETIQDQGSGSSASNTTGNDMQLVEEDIQEWKDICSGRWLFQRLTDRMLEAVLHPTWQVRHGAAMALREVLRSQAGCAGVSVKNASFVTDSSMFIKPSDLRPGMQTADSALEAQQVNSAWLQDCIIRLMCVLALDRFGDYVSDQVVAPVRETAAQALGVAMQGLSMASLQVVMDLLGQLKDRDEWQVRHGCVLGWKYVLAARKEVADQLLPRAMPPLIQGLTDKDDDVRAAAAEALVPVTDALLASGVEAVTKVRSVLWDVLLELQELSASTASVMYLLAQLHADPSSQGNRAQLAELLPRLWQFLRHTLRSVRAAAVSCLQGILDAEIERAEWLTPVLSDALALVYQNLLLEEDESVLEASGRLWQRLLECASDEAIVSQIPLNRIQGWAMLASTPPGAKLDARLMVTVSASASGTEQPRGKRARLQAEKERAAYGGDRVSAPSAGDRSGSLLRVAAGEALGSLGARWPVNAGAISPVATAVEQLLQSSSATARQVAGIALKAWADTSRKQAGAEPADQFLATSLGSMLTATQTLLQGAQPSAVTPGSSEPYSELLPYYKQLRQELGALMSMPRMATSSVLAQLPPGWSAESAPADQVAQIAVAMASDPGLPADLASRCNTMKTTAAGVQNLEAMLHSAAQASLAGAVISAGAAFLPAKLNILVQPLMGAVRREPDELLSHRAGSALASVMLACVGRKPSPNTKVATNLCTMACADRKVTPDAAAVEADQDAEPAPKAPAPTDAAGNPLPPAPEEIARLGAEHALRSIATQFGDSLIGSLPKLWELVAAPLLSNEAGQQVDPQSLVNSLQLLSVVGPALTTPAWNQSISLIPALACCCKHTRASVRTAASGCAAALAAARTDQVMPLLLRLLSPMLSATSDAPRRGAAEALSGLVSALRGRLAPFTVLLLVPMLGRMADPLAGVRRAATSGFAHLVELLPLSQGLPAPPGLDDSQIEIWRNDSCLLEQLLDNKKTADYALPASISLSVKLRSYQQEGINWLAFLRKFGLHGVLADDMGLGKTLQAISIIAAATVESIQEHQDAGGSNLGIPSVIACPPTLVGHWATEIERFLGADGALRPLCYEGTSASRMGLQRQWESGEYNVIIMSYESCRADIEWLGPQRWLYAVLDEGHIIKNAKTKVSQAVKRLISRHRLVLSGTPIQNDVLELWSIFDFLMPGFLGSEQLFNARFRRAVQVAKTSKKGSKSMEQGLLAADSLHKAVMPFVLRRTKDQVLKDLPPKIIQDVYCSMSPLQIALYDHFSKSNAAAEIRDGTASTTASANSASHVFASLQYLRKLCSHPELAIDPTITQHSEALEQHCGVQGGVGWERAVQDSSLLHAPKLGALRDILCQCQIGNFAGEGDDNTTNSAGHRVLVFAQLRSLLDIVERDVLVPGDVSFLRLDGSVAGNKRFEVAQRFNADPTIDVLLLTTGVGGLGLNLTTADTVVFLEHDWNPQKDLQAMDRAHRLGQKRTVNVYRLLMRDTLEEKIMGMQRFKLDVANAVVNTDNVSLKNMDTAQLLDLFSPAGSGKHDASKHGAAKSSAAEDAAAAAGVKAKGLKAMLAGLEELWDESQYAEEFSLDGFIHKLGR